VPPATVRAMSGEPAPDLDQLTGVVRAEDFDPPPALIAGCSVQHIAHPCRLSRCLTSHLPTTLQQMMHTGCTRGGDTRPVLIVGLWRSEGVGDGVWRRSPGCRPSWLWARLRRSC